MKFVYFMLAAVTIFVGFTLFSPLKSITGLLFDAFGGTEGMPTFLTLIVGAWPLIILIGFIVGAIFIMKTRQH